ncbi:MAG TPA: winged helix-turn-helix domain-containing protein [Vicinamibacterales bacterium]|nr:winged helix-turn-helix domain-containing protein [Vicinamibacterales bacterium]
MADSRDLGVATRRRFGTFEVDLATGELRRNGVKRKIQEQPFRVLAMLLDHPGEVVTREALRERLWPADTFVDFEHGLNTAIRKLRRALDEAAENPRYVETLARRGYRFIAPVTVEASEVTGTPEPVPAQPQPAKRWSWSPVVGAILTLAVAAIVVWTSRAARHDAAAPPAAMDRSAQLAVLPMRVLTEGENSTLMGIGIADAILTRLANVRSISIRPTSAILPFAAGGVDAADAGRRLNVEHVLTGTVQRLGDVYRFNMQMLRVSDGAPEWGQQIDVRRSDLFALEDQVSAQVVAALQLRLSAVERERLSRRYTDNLAAYEQYQEGRALLANYTDANLREAMERFRRALAIDPSYVLAEAGLAIAAGIFSVRFAYEREALDWGRQAEEYAQRALARDPNLAEAHLALASAAGTLYRNFDWPVAVREARTALAMNPSLDLAHSAIARAYYHVGLFDESRAESDAAEQRIAGTNLEVTRVRLANHLFAGHFEEARQFAQPLVARTDAPAFRQYYGLATFYTGDAARGKAILAETRRNGAPDVRSQASLAGLQAATGEKADASRTIAGVLAAGYMDHHVAYSLAVTAAQLGNVPDAMKWLRQASDTGFPCYPWFATDRLLDPLRGEAAFQSFMAGQRTRYEEARRRYLSR